MTDERTLFSFDCATQRLTIVLTLGSLSNVITLGCVVAVVEKQPHHYSPLSLFLAAMAEDGKLRACRTLDAFIQLATWLRYYIVAKPAHAVIAHTASRYYCTSGNLTAISPDWVM